MSELQTASEAGTQQQQQKQEEDKTPGIFCWHELMTRDGEASKKFYGDLLGWTAEEMDMGPVKYTFFKLGERPVAGMMQITEEMPADMPSHWLSYVTVEDIDASVAKAKELGAHICKDVTELPMGKFAVVTEPGGAGFALWEFGDNCPESD